MTEQRGAAVQITLIILALYIIFTLGPILLSLFPPTARQPPRPRMALFMILVLAKEKLVNIVVRSPLAQAELRANTSNLLVNTSPCCLKMTPSCINL